MRIIKSYYRIFQASGIRSISILLLLATSINSLAGCSDPKQGYPGVGEAFPLLALSEIEPLDGRDVELGDKILLINFWATWCSPCRKEMPDLQRLSETLDRDRFVVIGISVDEDSNLVREFLLEYQIRFANYQDQDQLLASRLLGIQAFPETYIVAPGGLILNRVSGERVWNEKTFEALLGERQAAADRTGGGRIKG